MFHLSCIASSSLNCYPRSQRKEKAELQNAKQVTQGNKSIQWHCPHMSRLLNHIINSPDIAKWSRERSVVNRPSLLF
jgi:hypothetical protein